MKFRTSYLVGLMATVLAVSSTTYFIDPAVAADTPKVKPLKIMGPDGQIRQINHQYGPTTSKDTFWSIAQKVRPDASVSVYQVMAAVFDANPHAFNSDNYNSLERGMILLIPSKEAMLAIPNSLAIARAERDDKQARSAATATTKAKAPKPTVAAPVAAEVKPKAEVKTEVAKTEPIATQIAVKTEPKMLSSDVNARLEAAESKNLSLTDELARTQDQLSVRNTDVEALKAKIEELNQQIAMLEETLQVTKQQNQALKAEVEAAASPVTAAPETPKEPDDLWRTLMESPLLLVAAAVIPALLILFLVFWALRRKRNKERHELASQQAAMAVGAAGMATGASVLAMDDDLDDMAVHLDTDHADSIDSLLDSGSVNLQPEQDIVDIHEQMDMAADMFIDQGGSVAPEPQFEEEEGQSLDDLWAEAMGDQEEAFAEEKIKSGSILEEEDLDALLAGLGSDDGAEQPQDDTSASTDSLAEEWVADVEMPSETHATQASSDDDLSAAIVAELEADAELDGLNVEDNLDIDALLADFDKPTEAQAEPDLGDEIAAELDDELTALGVEDTDDIDALLADFDKPAAPEPDLGDAIAAELDPELDDIGIAETDDIDALLASFDTSAAKSTDVAEDVAGTVIGDIVAEAELEPRLSETDEELDHLLAAEREASLPEDLSTAGDDLDALLAEFDVPEQGEADADDFNFDMETALPDSEKPADEDDLLKGIGAAHALDDSDDTFDLAQTINEESAALDEAAFSGFDADADDLVASAAAAVAVAAASAKEKESSFFNDLKANKSKDPHVLDWDTELDFAPAPKAKLPPTIDVTATATTDAVATKPSVLADTELDLSTDVDLSDDSILAAFSANADLDDDDVLATEDSFSLDDDHTLTVDEALAALDAQESRKTKPFVADHDLTSFQNEHGFIDIDKLLNDAEQDSQETDLYPDVDVEMSDVGSLIGDAAMIDVDDEENSVNAKLDLARAYIEIDDSDSAKALLKEVQIDGNARQQDEAAKLLKEIG
ncbi:FimV/HubP family polar landmark protein [Shewanella sp. CG12_big_fil_rev_8_21_14_0_65_47_15]|uniref:FimV/HubP family polar landmark protein n=1 Tax=Shewanella sp. CG12_big_fil_rev_8_21_14_0_65_47_15 TaxID=1975537 RepID=UPI000CAE2BF1|nr:FimV/HubP family polar landmark protein [Shewanella sp. CG12_big_fil_rev_8_21_14_0_65_47_15]PIW61269.1 MAG: pilus assembly protein FimV [Shewanella sp. CG12_big_fil_rev_8_21_14_0_65_47_15]